MVLYDFFLSNTDTFSLVGVEMKIDLTESIPVRGFLQSGTLYNREVKRTETELIVERCNVDFVPFFTRYTKHSFLGLLDYWKFSSWWIKEFDRWNT